MPCACSKCEITIMCWGDENCLSSQTPHIISSEQQYQNLHTTHEVWTCFSDSAHGSQMQCLLQQCQLHHCPLNEVISRHTGADVAKKTHCGVIVINVRLPPHPLHNLVDDIKITTCIMWRQLSPWRLGSRHVGSRLISGRRRGSQLEWFTTCLCRHHLETWVSS